MYSTVNLIRMKRDGHELSKEQIHWIIQGILDQSIPPYQLSALLMAIYFQGMTPLETANLTDAMLYSGSVLDFQDPTVIDKHSTGGVGDKTSFILAPIAAACGVKVPMIAGRGLGHTGGTVDKIESIKGFKTDLPLEQFKKQLHELGLVLIGQTKDIAPADKIMYALRDVTATVESIPLITASIMSKKLAEGTSGLVLDIKTGPGAFMKKKSQAKALAKSIRQTALRFNRNIITLLTDMSQPLGYAIGNSLEMIESFETLKGRGPKDLTHLSLELAASMIYLAKLAPSEIKAYQMARATIKNGTALQCLSKMIKAQGGDPKVIDQYELLPVASQKSTVYSLTSGYIHSIETERMGQHCVELGGGRSKASDQIDFEVGLMSHCKIGQQVGPKTPLVTYYHHPHQKNLVESLMHECQKQIFKISQSKPKKEIDLIIEKNISWSS